MERRVNAMTRVTLRRPWVTLLPVTLLFLHGSCGNVFQGSKSKPEYQILSKTEADDLYNRIRSQHAEIGTTQRFFLENSYFLMSVQALKQESRVACIAFYASRDDRERLGILAMKLRGDDLVETISGILWLTTGSPSFPNEIEGPEVTSSSSMNLCSWWSCVFSGSQADAPLSRRWRSRLYNPYSAVARVARMEELSGLPMVYHWFKHCY
jgi:hypothetical protein